MEKLKALAQYLIFECADPKQLGAIRLNKAIWFTDLAFFAATGKPVTEAVYVKRKHGPVPRDIRRALNTLVREEKIEIQEPEYPYDTRKFKSLRPLDHNILSQDEQHCARFTLGAVLGHTATEISEMTHDATWEAAADGEEIPIYAFLGSRHKEITPEVVEWAETQE